MYHVNEKNLRTAEIRRKKKECAAQELSLSKHSESRATHKPRIFNQFARYAHNPWYNIYPSRLKIVFAERKASGT